MSDVIAHDSVKITSRGANAANVQITGPGGKALDGVTKATWSVDSDSMSASLELHLDCWATDVDLEGEPRYFLDLAEFDASAIPMPEGLRLGEVRALGADIRRAVAEAHDAGMKKAYALQAEAFQSGTTNTPGGAT